MGPPGAGKGTQGELLVDRLELPRYATGDMLRAARKAETRLGRRAARYMDAGELVPDELILAIVEEALDRDGAWEGFIFDGFPRTVAQAEGLERLLERRGRSLDAVVSLEVPEEELVRRLARRRVCGACGEVTRAEGDGGDACPACGGTLVQRSDDRPETVRRRLEVYRRETTPVLRWYADSEVPLLRVDGTGGVDAVHARIRRRLPAS